MARLTSVANVKRFLAIPTANQDTLIAQLIVRESDEVQRVTSRVYPFVDNVGVKLNGTGTKQMVLPSTPILEVSALTLSGVALTASADGVLPGYLFDNIALYLVGSIFPMGLQNITASWRAGWAGSTTDTVPAGNTPTLTPDSEGFPHTDRGVVYAANGAAVAGYTFSEGVYTFNASDANASVTMSYYYVPAAVEQAVIEMVGLDLKQRDNIGISSKSLAGESISYEKTGMPASVKEMLNPFKRKAPV